MKTIRCPKLVIYLFAFALVLLLTGCSSFVKSPEKLFLSSSSAFDTTQQQLQVHQKFSEDTATETCPQWQRENLDGTAYNLETVETIKGKVVNITYVAPMIHLEVTTDDETIPVYLGPAWYIENQDMEIQPKDMVEIQGSRIDFDGEPVIIAAEITQGNTTLKLRDEDGIPLWNNRKGEEKDWILDMYPYLCNADK